MLTVDQLAKKLGIEIAEPKDRKKKVASILKKMNTYHRKSCAVSGSCAMPLSKSST